MRLHTNSINNAIRLAAAVFAFCAYTAYAQENTEVAADVQESVEVAADAQENTAAAAQNPAPQNSDLQNSIQSLSVSSSSGGKLVLKVGLKNAPAKSPLSFTITTPPRIAFDFPDTVNGLGKSMQEFGEGELRSANIVHAGKRTRLVVNLNQMLVYDTRIEGNNLLITLQGKAADASDSAAAVRFAEAQPSVQKYGLRDIDFSRGKNGEGRVQIDLSDAGVGVDIKPQGKNLIVDFIRTSLPRNLQRKLDVTDFGTPIEGIDTFVQGDNVRMVIQPKGFWEHIAYQTDNKLIVEVKAIAEDANKLVKGSQIGYAGEKLTLSFQNIAVREALNVIADFTNLNMVISDTVSGNLTLRLKDVPWDQALQIILDTRGLDMRKNGNVIQVAPREELAAKEKLNLAATQEIAELEVLRTESFQLSYQKGAEVAALLSSKEQRMLSKRGSAVVDARTNTVFVQDTPSSLERVRSLIKQIDVAVRQVMIEARFVEAGDTFKRNLGGRLGFSGPAKTIGAFNANVGSGSVNLPGSTFGAGGDLNLDLSVLGANPAKVLSLELTASEVDGKTKSIASPRVVTANGTEASIEAGVEIPYLTVSSTGTQVQFKKAVLSLKVTPQITPDDNVSMTINVNQDTVGEIFSGVPSVNTKKVATQVLVENGGTVVIGGVYTQNNISAENKVPLLGDVPLLGWLFKNQEKRDEKKELLIFITPKILKESLNLR